MHIQYSPETHPKLWQEVEELLDYVHEIMRDSFYYAAVPQFITPGLFADVRDTADGRSERIVRERLDHYAFVERLPNDGNQEVYRLHPIERALFNIHAIRHARELYIEAQRNAFDHWQTAGHRYSRLIVDRNQLYHLFFIDRATAEQRLLELADRYLSAREFAGFEQLIDAAREARYYLAQLDDSASYGPLDNRLLFLDARLHQSLGNWEQSRELLDAIDTAQLPALLPYVTRAKGYVLANLGDRTRQADAIALFEMALKQFEQQTDGVFDSKTVAAERGRTELAIGNAYSNLAGNVHSRPIGREPIGGLVALLHLIFALPLVLLLRRHLGRRVWQRRDFWPVYADLDWVVGRFYAQAAAHYQNADQLLQTYGRPEEGLAADEQLANLYLRLGDAVEARRLLQQLLDQTTVALNPYRRATIELALAEAQLALAQRAPALTQLEQALPVMRELKDREAEARAERLLGEATSDDQRALDHFERALSYYDSHDRLVAATEVRARLAQSEAPALRERLQQLLGGDGGRRLRYTVRYRHPATVWMQRLARISFLLLIMVVAMATVRLHNRVSGVPDIEFNVTPVLDPNPAFSPALSQGVVGLTLTPLQEPTVLLGWALALLLLYVVGATVVGYVVISRARSPLVQSVAEKQMVSLAGDELARGSEPSVPLDDRAEVVVADVSLFDDPIHDDSQTIIRRAGRLLRLQGNTLHYNHLQRQLVGARGRQIKDLSYSLFHSGMGLLFVTTLLLFALLALLTLLAPSVLTFPLAGPYAMADLHSYLFLGFLLPLLWWFVIQPERLRNYIDAPYRYHLVFLALGAALALYLVVTQMRFNLTSPNIYLPLLALVLIFVGGWGSIDRFLDRTPAGGQTSWQARLLHAPTAQVVTAALAALAVLLAFAIFGNYLVREVLATHHVVQANYARNLAAAETPLRAQRHYAEAIVQYTLAIDEVERTPLALESSQDVADLYANRGAVHLALGTTIDASRPSLTRSLTIDLPSYQAAIADFDQSLALQRAADRRTYLWRAFAYQSLGQPDEALVSYAVALGEQSITDRMVGSGRLLQQQLDALPAPSATPLAPLDAVKAWTGVGWLRFAGAEGLSSDDATAIDAFEEAVKIGEAHLQQLETEQLGWLARLRGDTDELVSEREAVADAYLGLGYARYVAAEIEAEYVEARAGWQRATELDPLDAVPLINVGTASWRIANVGGERCDNYRTAIADFDTALKLPGQEPDALAFSQRTAGQIEFLLGYFDCDPDPVAYQRAIDRYDEALRLAPNNAFYLHMRARLSYSLWSVMPPGTGPAARVELLKGLRLLDRALAIDPKNNLNHPLGDYTPQNIDRLMRPEAIVSTTNKGDGAFAQGNYSWARQYYALVAGYNQNDPVIAFKMALAALANGDDDAAELYRQARALAENKEQSDSIVFAYLDLLDFAAERDSGELPLSGADLGMVEMTEDLVERVQLRGDDALAAERYSPARNAYDFLRSQGSGTAAIEMRAGRAAQCLEDIDAAAAYYSRGILLANSSDDHQPVLSAWNTLDDCPGAEQLAALFERSNVDPVTFEPADELFAQALAELANGDGAAVQRFSDGVAAALIEKELATLESALLQLSAQPASRDRQAIVAATAQHLSDIGNLSDDAGDVAGATRVAVSALALGDVTTAAEWLNTAVLRLETRPDVYLTELRPAWTRLRVLWQHDSTTAAPLLPAFVAGGEALLQDNAGLIERGIYWRRRAWFMYDIGQAAYLAGLPQLATDVLAAAQPVADRAAELGSAGGDQVNTYLPQAAEGWYRLIEGNELFGQDRLEEALVAYQTALQLYQPIDNRTAKLEQLQVKFKAGLTALLLGDLPVAEAHYREGVALSVDYGLPQQVAAARAALEALSLSGEQQAAQTQLLALLDE